MAAIKAVVHGLGNIGRSALDCLKCAEDFEVLGVVRRSVTSNFSADVQEFASLEALCEQRGKPDVAILCVPSRSVAEVAAIYLAAGVNTVDGFDIHSAIPEQVQELDKLARAGKCAAITAAGWDPGTDSVMRALFEAMVPVGTTFTNFGRGRSMGHSVAARVVPGVQDAVSITIPQGGGRHSRLVYVLLTAGADFETVKIAISQDAYFKNDSLEVRQVKSLRELSMVCDNSHGVLMERIGASGTASNQRLEFDMRIDNPALTAQVLVSCARAVTRLSPGAYTMIDVPPVALLQGERLDNIARLV